MKWSAVHYYRSGERTNSDVLEKGNVTMRGDRRSIRRRGARLWAVALLLAAMLLTLASVAVAAEGELPSGQVTPAFGPAAGGTSVTIVGSGFTGATGVTFGGVAATDIAINGDGTAITATTPAHDVDAVPVVVTEADGTPVAVGGFFFIPATTTTAVTVTGVGPLIGSTAGHTPVVITGSGFQEGAQVAFGGAPATGVHVLADAIIIAVTPGPRRGRGYGDRNEPERPERLARQRLHVRHAAARPRADDREHRTAERPGERPQPDEYRPG
jgi:hypothetical protein